MGLFDFFRGRPAGPDADRILTPDQIEEVLADDYGSHPDAVVFVCDQSSGRMITPVDLMFLPFLNAQFSQDPKLGMIYGMGSGCALLRKTALERVQAQHRSGQRITSCQAYIDALARLGYSVKQDPKLDLDLLP